MKTRKADHAICSGCGEGKPELDGLMFTVSKVYCDACLKPQVATLTIVPASATHIAFLNGETYSREEVLRAVNSHDAYEEKLRNASAELRNVAISLGKTHEQYGFIQELADDLYNVTLAKAEGKE